MSSDPFYASQFESSPRIEWSTRGHPSHFVKQLVGKVQGTAFSVQTKEANAHLPIENETRLDGSRMEIFGVRKSHRGPRGILEQFDEGPLRVFELREKVGVARDGSFDLS